MTVQMAFILLEILRAVAWPAGHKEAGQVVFRSEEELAKVWVADGGKKENLPKVNWEKEMVVAVFAGECTSGGNAIKVLAVAKDNAQPSRVAVVYRRTVPRGAATALMCWPSHVVVVPRADGVVKFASDDAPGAQRLLEELGVKEKP